MLEKDEYLIRIVFRSIQNVIRNRKQTGNSRTKKNAHILIKSLRIKMHTFAIKSNVKTLANCDH